MSRVLRSIAGTIIVIGFVAAGCGSDGDGDTSATNAQAPTDELSDGESEAPADSMTDATDESSATTSPDAGATDQAAPSADSGTATLTFGDTTYEFDNFV